MNKVILLGTVADRPLPASHTKDCCGFSLVLSKSLPGWASPRLDYVHVMAYGRTADFCRLHLARDTHDLLEGRLTRDRWYSPRSGPRSRLLVVAEQIHLHDNAALPAAISPTPSRHASPPPAPAPHAAGG